MSHLKYITCGYEDCSNGHSWGPGIQPDHVIQYIVKGRGYYEIRGRRYTVSAGQCFYIVPGEITHYYPDMSDPWIYRWIKFGGVDASEIMSLTSLPDIPVTPAVDIGDIFEAVSTDVARPAARLKNEAYLHSMLSVLAERFPSETAKNAVDYLRVAKKYISANLDRRELSVSELAHTVGLERSYLFRLFKEGVGMSVREYIINARLETAREMFDRGITQVNVVAFSCGYDDPLYFSNSFKKKYGMSPKNYINKKVR